MRIWLIVVLALAFPGAFGCRKAEPEPEAKPEPKPVPAVKEEIEPNFRSELAGFKMWFPGKPTEKVEDGVPQCFWLSPDGKGTILVIKVKTETPRDPTTDTENLKELVRLTLPPDYKEEGRREFRTGEDAGLELRGKHGESQEFLFQTILVGTGHYFQITAVGEAPFIASKDVRDALASFRSIK